MTAQGEKKNKKYRNQSGNVPTSFPSESFGSSDPKTKKREKKK
jgi:hypothetical protein